MTPRRRWTEAIVAAGAVRAAYVPDASTGGRQALGPAGAELVEGAALELHPVPLAPAPGPAIAFLDGIQQWAVVGYDGVPPVVRANVAAAVRRRGPDRRPRTADEAARELAITRLAALSAPVRRALEGADVEIVDLAADETGQPGRALRAAHLRVDRAREQVEREVGERCAGRLGPEEWLVRDGRPAGGRPPAQPPPAPRRVPGPGAPNLRGAR